MRGQQGECGAAREGCRSARACDGRCRHRDGRTQLRQLKAGRKAQQQHSSPGAVRLHSQNAHSSALLARWARPMCTAVTARSGAPFAQTVSLLQRTPASRRIPAPKGASGTTRSKSRRLTGPNAKSVKMFPGEHFGAAVSARLQNSQNSQKPPAGGVPGR